MFEHKDSLFLSEDWLRETLAIEALKYPFDEGGLSTPEYRGEIHRLLATSAYAHRVQDYLQERLFLTRSPGWAILSGCPPEDLVVDCPGSLSFLSSLVGIPFRMVRNLPTWQHLGVDLQAEPYRFGGIGYQPLHIDGVNVEFPPDVVVLACVRNDPGGGGASLLAGVEALISRLSADEILTLSKREYAEGKFFNLDHVGREKRPFSVMEFKDSQYRVRFSGKVLPRELPKDSLQRPILEMVDRILSAVSFSIMLQPGDVLFINQLKVFHGRLPLAKNQSTYSPSERRYLRQGFIRTANGWIT
ncbi:TauD/TfdA family dioxygenase [Rhizobium sp. PAMB 3174]